MNNTNKLSVGMSFVLIVCAIITHIGSAGAQETAGQDNIRVQVAEILNQIQNALITVQDTADSDDLPKLDSVTVKLSTQFVAEGGGKINLYVLSFGAKTSEAATQSISLKLTPPEPGTPKPAGADEISDPLAKAILSAVRGAAEAKKRKPVLQLSELEATIKFVVDSGVSGGVKFTIMPVTIEMDGKVSKATTQEISVTFK